MNLTFVQDHTSNVSLDSELMGTPDSGLYWNQGVHPLVTINNLLTFMNEKEFTFSDWAIGTIYVKYEDSQKTTDIVTYNDVIYQSLTDNNTGNQPDISPTNWLETNIESLKIKTFLKSAERNMISQLHLTRKLVDSQYIYNVGETLQTLPNDYAGWVIEPKGSDYVKIRINQLSLQANTTNDVSLYVINQGVLVDTLTLHPQDGRLVFEDIGYSFNGIGKFIFAFDSQEVKTESAYNDPLKYDGFVLYPVSGIGTTPQDADYSFNSNSNGLNFNISAYLDSAQYLNNNLIDFSKMLQTQFEYDLFRLMLSNANNQSSADERNIADNPRTLQLLTTETLDTEHLTIAKKYDVLLQDTKRSINKTFDRFLKSPTKFRVKTGTIG
ncbi:MAG: hypothetical protein GY679_00080 [Mycoplasma sp.]|nr:hypothetical protein [Mycoplasma sp.]